MDQAEDMEPTAREEVWAGICSRISNREERLIAWSRAKVIPLISDAEWAADHAGACGICHAEPARLYPGGWRCAHCLTPTKG